MDRIDTTSFLQFLNLNLNGCFFLGVNWMKFLSNRLGIWIRCDFMLNYFWMNAWPFLIRPGKNVTEFFEKIRVNLNLFGGEICSDEDILHDAGGSGDIDRYRFRNGFHITLGIDLVCS